MSDFAFIIKEKSRTLNIMNHATAHKFEQSVCFKNQNSVQSDDGLEVYEKPAAFSLVHIKRKLADMR